MKTVLTQVWEGPSGRTFFTIHPTEASRRRFNKGKPNKSWVSGLHKRSRPSKHEVEDEVYEKIVTALKRRDGLRASVYDFKLL